MSELEIDRCSRRCAGTGQELRPGDVFYSVVRLDGTSVRREDYSSEAWRGAPEDAIGWWQSRIPDPSAIKRMWAPHDVMLHVLETKLTEPLAKDFCYVLALLLIRRKIVRLEAEDRDDHGNEQLVVFAPKTEVEYRVPVSHPSKDRIAEIEAELGSLLSSGQAEART